jgi:AcrR family transcriptional regulator
VTAAPASRPLTPRAAAVVAAARRVLERDGRDGLTMRTLADELEIKAPSLYKHVAGKAAIEAVLVEAAMTEMGTALRAAVRDHDPGDEAPVPALLTAYRTVARAGPSLYRLATHGPLDRAALAPGLEDWAGEPFLLATGEPYLAQALWAFAHGTAVLEIDGRFLPGSDLDRTWAEGAAAFAEAAGAVRAGADQDDRR